MDLIKQISAKGLVLDGAMSTALEKQGIDTNTDLWTAVALEKDLNVNCNNKMADCKIKLNTSFKY